MSAVPDESHSLKTLTISAQPYFHDNIKKFDQEDSPYSDVFLFIPPDLEKSLELHSGILADASTMFDTLFRGQLNAICSCKLDNRGKKAVEWRDKRAETDDTYRNVLGKCLRLCYGIDQTFTVDECPAALVVLFQLQLNCLEQVKTKIEQFMIAVARDDTLAGAKMLCQCAVVYDECHNDATTRIDIALARIVLTYDNMMKYKNVVVNSCLMKLQKQYLDMPKINDANVNVHIEVENRLEYIKQHSSMPEEEKKEIIDIPEFDKFRALNTDEILQLLENKLIQRDIGFSLIREKDREREEESEKSCEERDELKKLYAEKCKEYQKYREEKEKMTNEWVTTLENGICQSSDEICSYVFVLLSEYYRGKDNKKTKQMLELAEAKGRSKLLVQRAKKEAEDRVGRFYLLYRAACMGNSEARVLVAMCYGDGDGIEKDEKVKIALLNHESERGDGEADRQLAIMYKDGNGVEKDMEKAIQKYKEASEKGNTQAMVDLGLLVYKERGPQGYEEAKEWFIKAAEGDNCCGLYQLALFYFKNEEDLEKAKTAFEKAVKAAKRDKNEEICNNSLKYLEIICKKEEAAKLLQIAAQSEKEMYGNDETDVV